MLNKNIMWKLSAALNDKHDIKVEPKQKMDINLTNYCVQAWSA